MSNALQSAVSRLLDVRGVDADGHASTPVEGVGLMRAYAPTAIAKMVYRPLICLVLQGAKQVTVGSHSYVFVEGQSALVSADVSAVSRIERASHSHPYLAMAILLDMALLHELSARMSDPVDADVPAEAVLVDETDQAIADCALRLLRLAERPGAIQLLREPLLRELHYWLLAGRHGAALRRLARPDGVSHRIARAVAMLRDEFHRPLRMTDLSAVAGMSPSTFNSHFRSLTNLSPLQFQKQLRLIEARRRMLNDGLTVTKAAFEVGYASVSQFNREYGRMFGVPPGRDIGESRAVAHRPKTCAAVSGQGRCGTTTYSMEPGRRSGPTL